MFTSCVGNGLCCNVWKSLAASADIWYAEKFGMFDFESKLVDDVSVFGTWWIFIGGIGTCGAGDGGSSWELLKFVDCVLKIEFACCSICVLDAADTIDVGGGCWIVVACVRVGSTTAIAFQIQELQTFAVTHH